MDFPEVLYDALGLNLAAELLGIDVKANELARHHAIECYLIIAIATVLALDTPLEGGNLQFRGVNFE